MKQNATNENWMFSNFLILFLPFNNLHNLMKVKKSKHLTLANISTNDIILSRPCVFLISVCSPPGVEHSGEEIKGCHLHNANSSNELSTVVSNSIKYKQMKVDTKWVIFLSWHRSSKWLSSKLLAKHKVRKVSIPAWSVQCVKPHWRVVIQQNSQSVDDSICV